jgi:hypothetical protein
MADQFLHSLTDAWNSGGTTFYAIRMNVTDTASAAGSKLIELQVGGVSQFAVDKSGNLVATGNLTGVNGVLSGTLGVTGNTTLGGTLTTTGAATLGGTAIPTSATLVTTTRAVATGTGLTGGGSLSADRTLALTGQALALHNLATDGLIARTGAATVAGRTLTAGTNITVTNGNGVSGNPTVALEASPTIQFGSGAVGTPSVTFTGDTDTGMWRPGANLIAWSTNGAERMRITSAGNVGIGTSAPGAVLEVNGAGSSGVIRTSATGRTGIDIQKFVANADALVSLKDNGNLRFETNATERMRIDASGNVGIGTSAPETTLHVEAGFPITTTRRFSTSAFGGEIHLQKGRGSSASPTIVLNGDGLGAEKWFGYDGSTFRQAGMLTVEVDGEPSTSSMPGRFVFSTTPSGSTSSSERMRITSAGNVGIGTSSPNAAALLDVSSTTKGVLFPRMTGTQRDAISTPPDGLVLYNTTTNKLQVRAGGAWVDLH